MSHDLVRTLPFKMITCCGCICFFNWENFDFDSLFRMRFHQIIIINLSIKSISIQIDLFVTMVNSCKNHKKITKKKDLFGLQQAHIHAF